MIIDLFEQWAGLYGKKLQGRQNLSLQTAETWAVALKLMNVSKREFDTAHAKSLCMEWPPTAAYDFLALGRTETKGYPDTRKAYEHAVDYSGRLFDDRDDWKHVVIHETARRIGFTKLATSSELYTWSLWRDVYSKVCDEHKAGADFKLPLNKSKQLAYEHTPVQPDSAFDDKLNDFFAKYGSKKGEAV